MTDDNAINNLTSQQEAAVNTPDGLWCVLASAGSGKTKTFVERITNMVNEQKINPGNILAVTFTKKASEEMQKRLEDLIGKDKTKSVTIGTFHSVAYRLLMSSDQDFSKLTIAPDWWILQKLNDLCGPRTDKNHLGLNLEIRAGELASFISYQKANLITPEDDFIIDDRVYFVKSVPDQLLRKAYATFEKLKEESRQATFDDMLVKFYNKLKNEKEFRSEVSSKYRYVLIDEFQDTSTLMLEIIKIINNKNLFVVGDWRQSIYSFINANVENILNFTDDFKGANLVELSKNFRSTQNIVSLSNKIIENSGIEKYKHFKPSESVSEIGDKVVFSAYQNENQQAVSIAREIKRLNNEGISLSEIAILVRTNAQTAAFEQVFSDADIPYDVSKSASFFDKREILDLLSYARLVTDSNDDASLRRIINTPNRYLGKKFIEDLERFAGSKDVSLMQALRISPLGNEWKNRQGINSLVKVIGDLHYQTGINAGRFIRNIIKSTNYIDHVNQNTNTAASLEDRLESVEKLCNMASKFSGNISDFLSYVSIISDKSAKSKNKDAVVISTIHSSKGLEWDVAFVVNANQDSLPHKMNHDIEEERRLFYVATSRPRKKLHISWFMFDEMGEKQKESVFVRELIGDDAVRMNANIIGGSTESSHSFGA